MEIKIIPVHRDDGPAINADCARGAQNGFDRRRIWNAAKTAWADSPGADCCMCRKVFADPSSFSTVIGFLVENEIMMGVSFVCNDCCANPEVVMAFIDMLGRDRLDS
jgi:hypothetical protein